MKDSLQPEASGNNFPVPALGVKSVTVVPAGSNMLGEMEKLAEKLRAEGKAHIVPGGASNKIGASGYVSCAEEVLRQLFDRGLAIDHMVVPSGSAGTHAGIIAGMVGNNAGIPVTGIGVNRKKPVQEAAVLNLANETLEYIGVETRVPAEKVVAFDDYVGPGCLPCPPTPWSRPSRCSPARKAYCSTPSTPARPCPALSILARKGDISPKGSNVLFLHTGSPALYAFICPLSAPNRLLLSPCSPRPEPFRIQQRRGSGLLRPPKEPHQCPFFLRLPSFPWCFPP